MKYENGFWASLIIAIIYAAGADSFADVIFAAIWLTMATVYGWLQYREDVRNGTMERLEP